MIEKKGGEKIKPWGIPHYKNKPFFFKVIYNIFQARLIE